MQEVFFRRAVSEPTILVSGAIKKWNLCSADPSVQIGKSGDKTQARVHREGREDEGYAGEEAVIGIDRLS